MYDLMSWMQRKEAIGISSRAFDLLKGVWKLLAAVLSVRSCRQMYQLLGTPEGGAADGYVKVNDKWNAKSQVRPILQSPRSFLEGEVIEGCLHFLEIGSGFCCVKAETSKCHADQQINDRRI